MEKKVISSGIVAKVRAAGCLTEDELSALELCASAVEARQEIDALETQWAVDLRKYVQPGRRGSVSLPTDDDAWGITVIGGGLLAFGLYMLSQMKFETDFEYLPALFFGVICVGGGLWTLFRSIHARKVVGAYQAELDRFRRARRKLVSKLPAGFQPAKQVCRACLTSITDVHDLDSSVRKR